MICPNLNDPEVKAKFDQLLSVVPEYAYYLWDKYEGEVPAKYYNLVGATGLVAGKVAKGVQELFVSNPGLNAVGTPQQYSAYLDSIFPDSQVKDIVYHDGGQGKIKEEGFRKDMIGIADGGVLGDGFYFYVDRNKRYDDWRSDTESVLLNITNLSTRKDIIDQSSYVGQKPTIGSSLYEMALSELSGIPHDSKRQNPSGLHGKYIGNYSEQLAKIGIDGLTGPRGGNTEIVVFEPEQIHILGSQKDIAGFKKFVATSTMPTTMYSKVTLEDIKNHFLRLEVNLKLAQDLLNDPEYNKLDTYGGKIAYVGNKMWQAEIQKIQDLPSITLMGNRIYHTSTKYVQPHQILKYAETTALKINSKYVINGGKKIAWARFDESGVYIEFDPRHNYATEIIDFVESMEEEEMRAEVELLVLQEALGAEEHALMEKLTLSSF